RSGLRADRLAQADRCPRDRRGHPELHPQRLEGARQADENAAGQRTGRPAESVTLRQPTASTDCLNLNPEQSEGSTKPPRWICREPRFAQGDAGRAPLCGLILVGAWLILRFAQDDDTA